MPKLTIKSVTPTGKVDQGFGVPYYVTFEEVEGSVYAQKKTEPQVGDEWWGKVEDGKFGLKFVKDPYNPNQENRVVPTGDAPRTFKDNSDGMRQGMAINNAAKYVIERNINNELFVGAQELADEIKEFAVPIYKIDLNS
jgi:hypothetical protein